MNRKTARALTYLGIYERLTEDGVALRPPNVPKNRWVRDMKEYGRQANIPVKVDKDCVSLRLEHLGRIKGAWKIR